MRPVYRFAYYIFLCREGQIRAQAVNQKNVWLQVLEHLLFVLCLQRFNQVIHVSDQYPIQVESGRTQSCDLCIGFVDRLYVLMR